ncbi:MAG: hypothetical protein V2G44_00725 [bacterium JZ-2024 1]
MRLLKQVYIFKPSPSYPYRILVIPTTSGPRDRLFVVSVQILATAEIYPVFVSSEERSALQVARRAQADLRSLSIPEFEARWFKGQR